MTSIIHPHPNPRLSRQRLAEIAMRSEPPEPPVVPEPPKRRRGPPRSKAECRAMAEQRKRPVVCVETGQRWGSLSEAAESLGMKKQNLSQCIRMGKAHRKKTY